MNKTLAIALLVSTVAAVGCDPWVDDDCTPKDELPRRAMGAYWLHGVMSWIQATWMFIIMGAWISDLTVLGTIAEAIGFTAAGLNFIAYMPAAIVWTLTAADNSTPMYKHYYRALKATNVLGWLMWFINLVVWIVMLLFILLDGLIQIASGDTMPSILTPTIGLILDLAFQIIYATTYGYSRTLMKCWGYTFPELGDCVF